MKFMDVQAVDGTLKLSKIAKGADYFGVTIPEKRAWALMDRYLELGGNTIDTARIYGRKNADDTISRSEPIVGRWMAARKNRSDIILVTKGAHPDRNNLTKSRVCREVIDVELETSLSELGVDYVDIYFLHRDNPDMPVGEIMDMMDEHVKAGKIRALGASNWTVARINEANAYARAHGKTPFTISQIQWGIVHSTGELWNDPTMVCMNETEYQGYLENQIPVMGFASQGGGFFSKLLEGGTLQEKFIQRYDNPVNRHRLAAIQALCEKTGKSAAAIGMAFLTSNPLQSAALIGCSTLEQLEDTMSDCDFVLSAEECAALVK